MEAVTTFASFLFPVILSLTVLAEVPVLMIHSAGPPEESLFVSVDGSLYPLEATVQTEESFDAESTISYHARLWVLFDPDAMACLMYITCEKLFL